MIIVDGTVAFMLTRINNLPKDIVYTISGYCIGVVNNNSWIYSIQIQVIKKVVNIIERYDNRTLECNEIRYIVFCFQKCVIMTFVVKIRKSQGWSFLSTSDLKNYRLSLPLFWYCLLLVKSTVR